MSEKKLFEVRLEIKGYLIKNIRAEDEDKALEIAQKEFGKSDCWVTDAFVQEI